MADLASHSLGDLVTSQPDAARVFERFGLDYCCGGTTPLEAACVTLGLDPAEVAAALTELGDPRPADWANLSPAELVDHLEATHHAYLHVELERLHRLMDKVEAVHGERHPELAEIRSVYVRLRADLEPHLLKEERVIFPMIRELAAATGLPDVDCGSLPAHISAMLDEHDLAGELLARLRTLTADYTPPSDGCASYGTLFAQLEQLETDTHLHVHKENHLLVPAVLVMEDTARGTSTP